MPYQHRELKDDWEYVFFMQHFGIPTRLLDWTENPYIGLFFALTSAKSNGGTYATDAAVWMLDPIAWNRKVLSHISFGGGVLSSKNPPLDSYKPSTDGKVNAVMPTLPVAIYGSHNSPRIVAQRGVFTIFGRSTNSMEESYTNNDFPQDCLVKFVIPARQIEGLLASMTSIGMTDSVVFPDLDGLAKETKRFFGFNV